MIGAISPLSTLFGGAFGVRPTSSASSSSSASSTGGVTTPQDVVAISGVRPADPVSRNDSPQTEDHDNPSSQDGAQQQSSQQSQDTSQAGGQKKLSQDQQDQVAKLKEIDRGVHAHEQAHAAAGGALAGAPSYHYTTGPDGHQYAVGGEVSISIPSVSGKNPEASIQQLRQVIAAADAPADPSGQDRAVAAQAQAELGQAQAAAAKKSAASIDKAKGSGGDSSDDDSDQPTTGKTDKASTTPKIVGAPAPGTSAPGAAGASTAAASGGGSADPAPIQIVGPAVFGSKKPDQPATGQSAPSTGNAGTGGSSSTPSRASPIFAYQQAQSGFGQSRPRGSGGISLSI